MPNTEDIKTRVTCIVQVVQEHVRANPHGDDSITEAATFGEDLGMDDLDAVEILMRVEESFGVTLPDDAITVLSSPADVIGLVTAALRVAEPFGTV